jgi:hypothetical protein
MIRWVAPVLCWLFSRLVLQVGHAEPEFSFQYASSKTLFRCTFSRNSTPRSRNTSVTILRVLHCGLSIGKLTSSEPRALVF